MNMTSKELLKLLLQEGWYKDKQEGSHLRLKKQGYRDIILPMHNRDLAKGLLTSILKQAGLK